jgi:hypothetical protein
LFGGAGGNGGQGGAGGNAADGGIHNSNAKITVSGTGNSINGSIQAGTGGTGGSGGAGDAVGFGGHAQAGTAGKAGANGIADPNQSVSSSGFAYLRFATTPAKPRANTSFTVSVAVLTRGGAVDTQFSGVVTIALASGPTHGKLTGTLSVNAVKGVATFTGLQLTSAGKGYRLRVYAPNTVDGMTALFDVG